MPFATTRTSRLADDGSQQRCCWRKKASAAFHKKYDRMFLFFLCCVVLAHLLRLEESTMRRHRGFIIRSDLGSSTIMRQQESVNKTYQQPHQEPQQQQRIVVPKATIAYAVTVTDCSNNNNNNKKKTKNPLIDAAAVLKHSIHLTSIQNPNSTSKYDYRMFAFVHPDAAARGGEYNCHLALEQLGYEVQVRDTPVNVDEQVKNNKVYQRKVKKMGCCGEKEFLKLYAYTLTDFDIVVHLDLDTIILKPLDELFDAMLLLPNDNNHTATKNIPAAMWTPHVSHPINAMFTRDYYMADLKREPHQVGMQGGFLVLRPDQAVFEQLCATIRQAKFDPTHGWGHPEASYGMFYGAPQIQGLIPYYYGHLAPNTSVELNRCVYNQMAESPYYHGRCLTLEKARTCQDCRKTNFIDISTIHFTLCMKPWDCPHPDDALLQKRWKGRQASLCMQFHHAWHRIRYNLEQAWGTATQSAGDLFFGHCERSNVTDKNDSEAQFGYRYIPLQLPFNSERL